MELLESDSMPWNFWKRRNAVECPDRRGTFGEMLKSETVEMLDWVGAKEWKVPDSRILR